MCVSKFIPYLPSNRKSKPSAGPVIALLHASHSLTNPTPPGPSDLQFKGPQPWQLAIYKSHFLPSLPSLPLWGRTGRDGKDGNGNIRVPPQLDPHVRRATGSQLMRSVIPTGLSGTGVQVQLSTVIFVHRRPSVQRSSVAGRSADGDSKVGYDFESRVQRCGVEFPAASLQQGRLQGRTRHRCNLVMVGMLLLNHTQSTLQVTCRHPNTRQRGLAMRYRRRR